MDVAAKLTSKGQVTIPKSVREALHLAEGDVVVFRIQGEHAVLARTPRLLELAGSIAVPKALAGEVGGRGGGDPNCSFTKATLRTLIDTNVLVRHLTGDPPESAQRATRVSLHIQPGRPRFGGLSRR